MLQNFCATSYGLYTEHFIKKIATDAANLYEHLHRFCMKKNLRKCVKKFMLTDLELIFMAHYCSMNEWEFENIDLLSETKISEN